MLCMVTLLLSISNECNDAPYKNDIPGASHVSKDALLLAYCSCRDRDRMFSRALGKGRRQDAVNNGLFSTSLSIARVFICRNVDISSLL